PLGVLYLASMLMKKGHECRVLDFYAEPFNEDIYKMHLDWADAVGITITSFTLAAASSLVFLTKILAPEKKIIVGGPHVSLYPEQILMDTPADIAIMGEAEYSIEKIAKALSEKTAPEVLAEIPGVRVKVYSDTASEVKFQMSFVSEELKSRLKAQLEALGPTIRKFTVIGSKQPEIIEDLDSLPFPARELVSHYDYGHLLGSRLTKGKFTSIITSRGCPMSCRFCTRLFFGMNTFRARSAENVLGELRQIKKEGYDTVIFVDDNFTANRKRAMKIMNSIAEEKMGLELWVQGRVDAANRELFEAMKRAGVTLMLFGIESGNQDTLDYYNKKITLEQAEKAVRLSKEMGFFTESYFILGAEIETEKHFRKTIAFAKKLPLDLVYFLPLEYAAGAQLWNEAVAAGKIQPHEYLIYAGKERGLAKYDSKEILAWCKRAHKEFYMRPSYWWNLYWEGRKKNDLRLFHIMRKYLWSEARKVVLD
ncbi:MAG: radical SAM protein, partial [Thermoplasmata archaeon]